MSSFGIGQETLVVDILATVDPSDGIKGKRTFFGASKQPSRDPRSVQVDHHGELRGHNHIDIVVPS